MAVCLHSIMLANLRGLGVAWATVMNRRSFPGARVTHAQALRTLRGPGRSREINLRLILGGNECGIA
jgi:hypothetical protein